MNRFIVVVALVGACGGGKTQPAVVPETSLEPESATTAEAAPEPAPAAPSTATTTTTADDSLTRVALAAKPCTSKHHDAACFEGEGEYLRRAGLGGASRGGRIVAIVAERGPKRFLVIGFGSSTQPQSADMLTREVIIAP